MKRKNNNDISPTKRFLVNVLYHAGFNKEGIKTAEEFTWKQAAEKIVKALEQIL